MPMFKRTPKRDAWVYGLAVVGLCMCGAFFFSAILPIPIDLIFAFAWGWNVPKIVKVVGKFPNYYV